LIYYRDKNLHFCHVTKACLATFVLLPLNSGGETWTSATSEHENFFSFDAHWDFSSLGCGLF